MQVVNGPDGQFGLSGNIHECHQFGFVHSHLLTERLSLGTSLVHLRLLYYWIWPVRRLCIAVRTRKIVSKKVLLFILGRLVNVVPRSLDEVLDDLGSKPHVCPKDIIANVIQRKLLQLKVELAWLHFVGVRSK